jgi:hypothetical protein
MRNVFYTLLTTVLLSAGCRGNDGSSARCVDERTGLAAGGSRIGGWNIVRTGNTPGTGGARASGRRGCQIRAVQLLPLRFSGRGDAGYA